MQATTAEEYVAMMCAYRVWAGKPSYRTMSSEIGKRYVPSTLSSIGGKKTLPRIDLALAYIQGCGGGPADLELWKEAWRRIALS